METYQKLSDEELIKRLRLGDEKIMDFVLDKYKPLVRKKANAMFLIGGDTDDLIQEGMIGLFKAIRDFKEEKEATFFSFAQLCITRQIYSAVEASNRKKHAPLNSYVSFLTIQNQPMNIRIPARYSCFVYTPLRSALNKYPPDI